jgi:MFS family permease
LKTIRWGMLFYIAAALMIAFSAGFWGFWLAMVVLTLGQMMVVPRASALAANLAPVDKRGRYMSLYGLTWNVAAGISPVVGGLLSDRVGARAPWFGAAVFGLLAVGAFWWLQQRGRKTDESNF